jgi:hypothetical protein
MMPEILFRLFLRDLGISTAPRRLALWKTRATGIFQVCHPNIRLSSPPLPFVFFVDDKPSVKESALSEYSENKLVGVISRPGSIHSQISRDDCPWNAASYNALLFFFNAKSKSKIKKFFLRQGSCGKITVPGQPLDGDTTQGSYSSNWTSLNPSTGLR